MNSYVYPLSVDQRRDFHDLGYLYLSDYVPQSRLEDIRGTISKWTKAYADECNLGVIEISPHASDFDAGLLAMRVKNPEGAGIIYDGVKKMPPFMQWAADPRHVQLAVDLLASREIGVASRGWGMRIDYPGDTRHATQLHQDIVSQLSGPSAIVIWAPLRDVTADMGPVVLYPSSHKEGIFRVESRGPASQDLVIEQELELRRRFKSIAPEVRSGDALVMDFKLLHESGVNTSRFPRWSMLTRFFDARHSGSIRIGWAGGIQEGNHFKDFADRLF
jgi:hypothetical protein